MTEFEIEKLRRRVSKFNQDNARGSLYGADLIRDLWAAVDDLSTTAALEPSCIWQGRLAKDGKCDVCEGRGLWDLGEES